jgi:hypothetical protein
MGRCSARCRTQACAGSASLGPALRTSGARRTTSRAGHAACATRGDVAPLTERVSGGRRGTVRFLPIGLPRRALLGAARPLASHRRGKRRHRTQSRHARPRDPLRPRRQSCTGSLRGAVVGPPPRARTRDAAHGAERARLRARECAQASRAARHRSVLLGALVRRLHGGATGVAWRSTDAPSADLAVARRLAAARAHRPGGGTAARPSALVVELTGSRPRTADGSEHALAPSRRHDAHPTLGRTRRLQGNTPLSRQPIRARNAARAELRQRDLQRKCGAALRRGVRGNESLRLTAHDSGVGVRPFVDQAA